MADDKYRCTTECFHAGRRWRPGDGKIYTARPGEKVPAHFTLLGADKEADVNAGYDDNAQLHMRIKEALAQLDPNDKDHWTAKGEPAMIAVEAILGFQVKRQDVQAAWPGFNQSTMTLKPARDSILE